MRFFKWSSLTLFAVLALALSSCTEDAIAPEVAENTAVDERFFGFGNEPEPTIVDLAIATPELSILVEAVIKADLVDVLSNRRREFTVFAPTNEAFLGLLEAAGFETLHDVPVDLLTTILLTHVVRGELFAEDLSTGYVKTNARAFFRPTDIFINTEDGVTINGNVNVAIPNVDAANGVVHVVDRVIMPSDIVTLAASNPNFSILVQALTRADLEIDFLAALDADGPFTVVAPTNQAFINLLDAVEEWNSLDDIPVETLQNVLLYHVNATRNYQSREFAGRPTVTTLLDGATWSTDFGVEGGRLTYDIIAGSNTANIIATDVQAQNGIIHGIDTVLLP
ncbi:MAG: fasciclin domain-containing protein [Bacteroidota bacterium]